MSFNLVDIVKDQIADQVSGYVGNMLGADTQKSKSLLEGAIPALLGGLMHTSSNPAGAKNMFDTLQNTDDSILDNLGDMLSGDKSSSLIDMGTNVLSSVLGGNNSSTLNNIINAVSGFGGVDKGSTKSIMGLLAPLILGVIKRKLVGDGGFDVGSLINMFTGQKENITKALPKGLNLNFDNDIADNISDTTHEAAREGKSFLGKILPLLLLLAAAWIAYNLFFKGASTQSATHTTTTQVTEANLGEHIDGTMKNLMSTLSGIKDVSSAKAAVPKLTETVNNLGTYAAMLDKLPANVQDQIRKYIGQYLPKLKDALNKVGSIPGVGAIIQPVVENLSAKLAMLQ